MNRLHHTLLAVSAYAALLTGYVIGVAHTGAAYISAPLFVHSWAKEMQEKDITP